MYKHKYHLWDDLCLTLTYKCNNSKTFIWTVHITCIGSVIKSKILHNWNIFDLSEYMEIQCQWVAHIAEEDKKLMSYKYMYNLKSTFTVNSKEKILHMQYSPCKLLDIHIWHLNMIVHFLVALRKFPWRLTPTKHKIKVVYI